MTASQARHRPSLLQASIVAGLMTSSQVAIAEGLDTILITASEPVSIDQPVTLDADSTEPRADLAEVLREISGVTAGRMSGHGLDPIIRGQREHQLNVLLDGAGIANACPNRMDPPTSFGNLAGYDEVEVRKGVTTLTRGPGGSGGSIELTRNTFERAAEPGVQSRFGFTTSSNGLTDQSSADVLMSNGNAYGRVIGQIANGDNYEDGDGEKVPSSYKQRSGTVIGGYRVSDATGIEVSVDRNRMLDTRYAGAGMDSVYDNATIYRLDGRLGDLSGPVDGVHLELSRANVDHLMDNFSLRDLPAGKMKMEAPAESHTTTARLTATSRVDAAEFNYGIDFERVEQEALARKAISEELTFRQWPDGRADQFGAFVEADWAISDADGLRMGARIDRFESEIDPALEKSIATNGNTIPPAIRESAAETKSDTEVSGLLRYTHRFDRRLSGNVGISRTAVAPNLTQRYVLTGGLDKVGNPDLAPEIHHQLDAGLTWQTDEQLAQATLFVDEVSDFILQDEGSIDGLPTDSTSYRNIDARLYGAELDLRQAVTDWLTAHGQIAYTRGRNTDDSRNLPQIPPLSGTLGLEAEYADFNGGVNLRWADRADLLDVASGLDTRETSGYGVVDLHAGYRISRNWKLAAGIDNLFDRTYSEHVNRAYTGAFGDPTARINEPGRTVWAQLTATF
ncbi:MAG: TonB-dependent receptor domain-containing protein [Guyparkeria sp.]